MNRPVVPSISVPRMSIEAFEAWAERQDGRYELVRGHPVMMNQTTWNHSKITTNLLGLLLQNIDPDDYHIAAGDFALQTGEDTLRLADILITPSNRSGKDRRTDEAVAIIEILSPSTTSEDFGPKQIEYLALTSLEAYLIVAQDKAYVWVWIKGTDGFPQKPEVIEAMEATIAITGLGLTLTPDAIYRRVDF
ncbi:MAG: Uma2 family endonuclease [Alphaproteobacteria bacterium]